MEHERRIEIVERAEVPLDGILLGGGAMVPFPLAALAVLFGDGGGMAGALAMLVLQVWSGAILIFLAGVRRGLSFRTEGGPRPSQIALSLGVFALGLGALLLPPIGAVAAGLAGYGTLLVLDPRAARRGEAPLYFARLRPRQMAVPVASLALALVALAWMPA